MSEKCWRCGKSNTTNAGIFRGSMCGCMTFLGLLLLPLAIIFRPIAIVSFIMIFRDKKNIRCQECNRLVKKK